ncbi:transcriptional regulator [Clostridia bacterium]|nr:transcriptional regulator [Clostridia bacterium]
MKNKETFSENLKNLRKIRKLSKTKLGELIGVERTAIWNYETGIRFPTIETLIAIADYFDVSLDYLVGRIDNSDEQ